MLALDYIEGLGRSFAIIREKVSNAK